MAKHLLSLLFLCCALLCSTLSLHAEIVTVNVPTAGTLSAALTSAGINTSTVTSLKITGNLKSTDFVGSGYGSGGILQTMTTWNLTISTSARPLLKDMPYRMVHLAVL